MTDEAEVLVQDTRVVIWTAERGNVAVSRPALGVAVDEVFLARCPPGAIVVEADALPDSHVFFDAWRLVDGAIAIDLVAAREHLLANINASALTDGRARLERAAVGLPNDPPDAIWQAQLAAKRAAVAQAASLNALEALAVGGDPELSPAAALAAEAAALLAGGLIVTGDGAPNGTYGCDDVSRQAIADIATGIAAGGGFPGGGNTFNLTLADRTTFVTFDSPAAFLKVAVAVRDFVYACSQVIQGRVDTLPSPTVVIGAT